MWGVRAVENVGRLDTHNGKVTVYSIRFVRYLSAVYRNLQCVWECVKLCLSVREYASVQACVLVRVGEYMCVCVCE